MLVKCGASVNKPDRRGYTPIQMCTEIHVWHCLDGFPEDIIRFLADENGANLDLAEPKSGLNLLGIACKYYDVSRLTMVLYYLSKGLPLQPALSLFLIMDFGFPDIAPSYDETQDGKQVFSILLIDNALNTSSFQPCKKTKELGYAGRVKLDLFSKCPLRIDGYSENMWSKDRARSIRSKPRIDMIQMLQGAGFVLSLPDYLCLKFSESKNETKRKCVRIIEEERSRIPNLTEFCRWEIRKVLGPGLISLGKAEGLPLPKPIIEYILLLDIIPKEDAQTMYDYFSGKKTLKRACVDWKNWMDAEEKVYGTCSECLLTEAKKNRESNKGRKFENGRQSSWKNARKKTAEKHRKVIFVIQKTG